MSLDYSVLLNHFRISSLASRRAHCSARSAFHQKPVPRKTRLMPSTKQLWSARSHSVDQHTKTILWAPCTCQLRETGLIQQGTVSSQLIFMHRFRGRVFCQCLWDFWSSCFEIYIIILKSQCFLQALDFRWILLLYIYFLACVVFIFLSHFFIFYLYLPIVYFALSARM